MADRATAAEREGKAWVEQMRQREDVASSTFRQALDKQRQEAAEAVSSLEERVRRRLFAFGEAFLCFVEAFRLVIFEQIPL